MERDYEPPQYVQNSLFSGFLAFFGAVPYMRAGESQREKADLEGF
jgi:hypothetical protein